MNDLMGEDDYGDEEEYGEEGTGKKAKGKVQEEEFDFMWVHHISAFTLIYNWEYLYS